jgi:DNA-binding MarR family transcriptional regulator
METVLLDFVATLDASLKQSMSGAGSGISRLTISQLNYLEAVHALGEPTITEIAERLNITKASVTAGVQKLAQMGYVTKTQSDQDRRVFHVRLTTASGALVAAKMQAVRAYGEFVRSALTPEEASQLEALITKLVLSFRQA